MGGMVGVTITHRCKPCGTFAQEPGRCTFCDEWLEPLESEAAMSESPAPPEWPGEEGDDVADRAPTRTKKQTRPRRTRQA